MGPMVRDDTRRQWSTQGPDLSMAMSGNHLDLCRWGRELLGQLGHYPHHYMLISLRALLARSHRLSVCVMLQP